MCIHRNARAPCFAGSMDWQADINGIEFLMDEIWPQVTARKPEATMTIVGRSPHRGLIEEAQAEELSWTFTGFVDDIRSYVRGAAAYMIPLRVGGGTRLKVVEAMGCPVVSTSIGVEGLPLADGEHYLRLKRKQI